MAYSGSDRVTIVSLTNGQLLARLADNDAQVYALSEPGIVILQGDPSQITSWLQQGSDLILQQQDGSTLEFQQFFSADAARQSQLVFQDGASQQQVQLTAQTVAGESATSLTPVTAEEAASTLSISRLATPDTTGAAAEKTTSAAAEADAAAKADVGATATPAPTISVPFGDGWLNRQEKIDGQTLSGSTGVTGSGQSVTVNISGTAYQATVGDDGKWSLALTSEQLMGSDFSTGKRWINVTATNAEGETGKASAYFFTDVSTPNIAFNEDRDDTINLRNAGNVGATLYGTGDAGDALTVTLGPLTWHTTVEWGGVWQVELTPAQAQQLQAGDYTLSATITDTAKNVGTASQSVTVISGDVPPSVTIDSLSDDNRIDLTAITSDITISGTADPGSTLVVALEYSNLNNWQLTVDSSGKWSVVLDEADAQKLTPGYYDIKATATDEYGVSGSATLDVNFYDVNAVPTLDIQPVTADDIVEASELNSPLNIYGLVSNISTGTDVEVKIGDNVFHGEVVGGSWNVTIEADVVKTIADGQYTLEISADNGTAIATASRDIILFTHAHSSDPTLTFNPLTADDAFYQNGQLYYTLSGTLTEGALPIRSVGLYGGDSLDTTSLVRGENNTFTVAISAEDLTSSFGLYVSYQDVAGNWQQSLRSVSLPDLPDTASADTQQAADTSAADAAAVVGAAADAAVTPATDTAASATSGGASAAASATSDEASATDTTAAPVAAAVLHPTINTPFGDGWLNSEEKLGGQTLSGTTGVVGSGQTVTVNISGTNYQASVTATGNWSLELTDQQLAGSQFSTGKHWINVTASNAEGDTGTTQAFFFTDISTPQVTIDTPADGTRIDLSQITEDFIFSGTGDEGDALTLTLGALTWNVTVGFDGSWQAALTPEQAQQLVSNVYTLQASITDTAKNVGTASLALDFYGSDVLPSVTIDNLSDDNRVDLSSSEDIIYISGTGEVNDYVNVTVGALTEEVRVGENGRWSAAFLTEDLVSQGAGDYTVTATITDTDGNTNTASLDVDFYIPDAAATLSVDTVEGDDIVSQSEAVYGILITGSSEHLPQGTDITVTLDGKTFPGAVSADGTWSIRISADDTRTIPDGQYTFTVTATDLNGTQVSATHDFLLLANPSSSLPEITFNEVTYDDLIYHNQDTFQNAVLVVSGTLKESYPLKDIELVGDVNQGRYAVTLNEDGSWTAEVNVDELRGSSSLTLSATDPAGNLVEQSYLVPKDLSGSLPTIPSPTIEPPFGDHHLDNDEKSRNETLSGTTGIIGEGQQVTVNISGSDFQATVTDAGNWSLTLTPETLAGEAFAGGSQHLIYVTVTDAAGREGTVSSTFTADKAASEEALDNSIAATAEDNPTDGSSDTDSHSTADSATAASTESDVTLAASPDSSSESTDGSSASAATPAHSENIDGVATAVGTEGDDTFTLSTLNLLSNLNGGAGQDTLVLNGSHEALDFASLGLKISNVETLDLGSSGSNSITLGQKDLLALTDNASEALTIKGADGSTVTLSTAEGGVWSDVGQRSIDGQQYELYHNAAASHDGTLADVLIQHNLQVQTA